MRRHNDGTAQASVNYPPPTTSRSCYNQQVAFHLTKKKGQPNFQATGGKSDFDVFFPIYDEANATFSQRRHVDISKMAASDMASSRRPLGDVANKNGNITTPESKSKADKWEKAINEAWDKKGLNSPLRQSSQHLKQGNGSTTSTEFRVIDSAKVTSKEPSLKITNEAQVDFVNIYDHDNEEGKVQEQSKVRDTSVPLVTTVDGALASKWLAESGCKFIQFDVNATQQLQRSNLVPVDTCNLYGDNNSLESRLVFSRNRNDHSLISPRNANNDKYDLNGGRREDGAEEKHETGLSSHRDAYEKSSSRGIDSSFYLSTSSASTSTSALVARLPSSSSVTSSSVKVSISEESNFSNSTLEIEECTADILEQEMASDQLMKHKLRIGKNNRRLPPSFCTMKFRKERRSSWTLSPLTLQRVDETSQTLNSVSNTTNEVSECIADVLHQTIANDELFYDKQPAMATEKSVIFSPCVPFENHTDTTVEIAECVADVNNQSWIFQSTRNSSMEIGECIADLGEFSQLKSYTSSSDTTRVVGGVDAKDRLLKIDAKKMKSLHSHTELREILKANTAGKGMGDLAEYNTLSGASDSFQNIDHSQGSYAPSTKMVDITLDLKASTDNSDYVTKSLLHQSLSPLPSILSDTASPPSEGVVVVRKPSAQDSEISVNQEVHAVEKENSPLDLKSTEKNLTSMLDAYPSCSESTHTTAQDKVGIDNCSRSSNTHIQCSLSAPDHRKDDQGSHCCLAKSMDSSLSSRWLPLAFVNKSTDSKQTSVAESIQKSVIANSLISELPEPYKGTEFDEFFSDEIFGSDCKGRFSQYNNFDKSHFNSVGVTKSCLATEKRQEQILSRRASILLSEDKFGKALDVLKDALKVLVSKHGEIHPLVASTHHNIGIVHTKRAQNALNDVQREKFNMNAMDSFCSAVHVARKTVGDNHPNVAVSLARIGLIYLQTGVYEESVISFQECLRIRRSWFGRKHPLVAKVYNNLGVANLHLGAFKEGLEAFENACDIQRNYLTKVNADDMKNIQRAELELADTLCNVGSICLDWSERRSDQTDGVCENLANKAANAFFEAVNLRIKCLGYDHSLVSEAEQAQKDAKNICTAANQNNPQTLSQDAENVTIFSSAKEEITNVTQRSPDSIILEDKKFLESKDKPEFSALVVDDEESCVISSKFKKEDCIWDEYSFPFDEKPSHMSKSGGAAVQMHVLRPMEWGDPEVYNKTCSNKIGSGATDYESSPRSVLRFKGAPKKSSNSKDKSVRWDETIEASFDGKGSSRSKCFSSSKPFQSSETSAFVSVSTDPSPFECQSFQSQIDDGFSAVLQDISNERSFETAKQPTSPLECNNIPFDYNSGLQTINKETNILHASTKNDSCEPHCSQRHNVHHVKNSQCVNLKDVDSLEDAPVSDLKSGLSELQGGVNDKKDVEVSHRSEHLDFLDTSGDGLVKPTESCQDSPTAYAADEVVMLQNPGKYSNEIFDLAKQYLKNGYLKGSLALFEALLSYYKSMHGELHSSIGSMWHNIGIVLLRAQDYDQALLSFQKAVRVRRGAIGRDHADVAVSLVKVGIAQLLLRQFDGALLSFREALSVRRHALGHLHPSTAKIYNNIGCVHVEFNELREARRAFESALDVQRNALCYEPHNIPLLFGAATTLCNLGYLYTFRGAHMKTSLVLQEAAKFQEKVFGQNHPMLLSILDSLADSYSRSGDNSNCMRSYKDIVSRLEDHSENNKSLSARKKRVLGIVLYKMSRIHRKQNDNDSALRLLKKSVSYIEGLGVPDLLKKIEDEIKQVKRHLKNGDLDWL